MQRWRLPISKLDSRMSGAVARRSTLRRAKAMVAIGWAADARVLLGLGAAYRLACGNDRSHRRRANQMLAVIGTTTILHHAIKKFVIQTRPDRMHGCWRGVIRTGRGSEAFPSGHAMHAGALASLGAGAAPMMAVPAWIAGGLVAASRVVLLAHWPSGVAGGFLMGIGVERLIRAWLRS